MGKAGLDVSERGRLPREVIQQYESEHSAGQQAERTARHQGVQRQAGSKQAFKLTGMALESLTADLGYVPQR